jgi:hypothetical protein
MSEPRSNFPFGYRLPTDVASQIRATADVPLVEMGSPRRSLAVLVLVLGILGGGLAAGLPSGETHAMRGDDCRPGWVVDAVGNVTRDENWLC